MITVIVAGIGLLVLLVVLVGLVDATHEYRWRKIAMERRVRWETRQLMLHGAYLHGSQHGFGTDYSTELRVYFAGALTPGPETGLPDTHATGMNDATHDVNEALNYMGPPPGWSGRATKPTNPTPAGVS
jgi:hypothetical protein